MEDPIRRADSSPRPPTWSIAHLSTRPS